EKAAGLARAVALEVEADGVPNKAGVPVSNTQFNIFYHLGLASYLAGDWAKAEAAYRECLGWSKNDDSVVATTDWLYLTLRRAGKLEAAAKALEAVTPRMKVLENGAYLRRLLMYKGLLAPEALLLPKPDETESELRANSAIYEYGLAQRDLWMGDEGAARSRLESIVGGGGWPAFACIAAEADLARLLLKANDLSTPEKLLRAWTALWNIYDLDSVPALFAPGEEATYFSSEKAGLIAGREALVEHHRSFGFAPGGQNRDSRCWLEGVGTRVLGSTARVAARWLFDRDVSSPVPAQSGPVSFVLVRDSGTGAWRIVHAHFSNDPPAK
ncbi:MAG: nuclear transport factor 2 family protein, partial [Candidatus Aminicenantes bacterium]|nr:nuclear transport factor 2 family protein [Candidatus Aminicenantes bacterium]